MREYLAMLFGQSNPDFDAARRCGAGPELTTRSILFVCARNICCSPMAAALFLKQDHGSGRIVRSAGLCGVDGQPVHPLAQEQMNKRGLDLFEHRARKAIPRLLASFDLIVVMEDKHRRWVERSTPEARGRVHLLGRWRNLEIREPGGKGRSEFENTAENIEQSVLDWSYYGLQRVIGLTDRSAEDIASNIH